MADLFSVNDLLAMGGQGGGLGAGWPLGTDQGSPAPAQGGLGGEAWPTSSLISTGLGMLGGGWAGGARGYATGAQIDQRAAQMRQQQLQYQQDLALRRQALGQQYEIAMKPQVSFHIDPDTDQLRAFSVDPRTGRASEISINTADNLSAQGIRTQVFNPFTQAYEECPPGVKCKDLRKRYSDMYADVKMGKESAPQALARDSYQVVKDANAALSKDDTDLKAFDPNTSVAEGVGSLGRFGKGIATKTSDAATTRFIEQKNAFMSEYAKWKRLNAEQAKAMEPYFFGDTNGNKAEAPIYRARRQQVEQALQQAQGPAARSQSSAPTPAPAPRAGGKINRARAKAAGYTDEEIDAYERGQ